MFKGLRNDHSHCDGVTCPMSLFEGEVWCVQCCQRVSGVESVSDGFLSVPGRPVTMTSCFFSSFVYADISVFGSDVGHSSLTRAVYVPALASLLSHVSGPEL